MRGGAGRCMAAGRCVDFSYKYNRADFIIHHLSASLSYYSTLHAGGMIHRIHRKGKRHHKGAVTTVLMKAEEEAQPTTLRADARMTRSGGGLTRGQATG